MTGYCFFGLFLEICLSLMTEVFFDIPKLRKLPSSVSYSDSLNPSRILSSRMYSIFHCKWHREQFRTFLKLFLQVLKPYNNHRICSSDVSFFTQRRMSQINLCRLCLPDANFKTFQQQSTVTEIIFTHF